MKRALAAILVAAVIPLGAARCSTGGSLPAKYQYTWMQEIPADQYYIVFQHDKPEGDWRLRGYVKGNPHIRVWVQPRQP